MSERERLSLDQRAFRDAARDLVRHRREEAERLAEDPTIAAALRAALARELDRTRGRSDT
jgi:CRP-like cAMP-binding protein